MHMKLIAQTKLQPTGEQAKSLKETIQRVNAACGYISEQAWSNKTFGRNALQGLTYYHVREKFGLSAQVAIHAVYKVSDAYKKDKRTKREFKPLGSITYDNRILTWYIDKGIVSIWTIDGRQKMPFVCGDHQRKLLESMQGEADLVCRNGEYYIHQVCDIEEPDENDIDGWLGVDMGIVNIAVTSDNATFSGTALEAKRQWFAGRRATLQKVGTLSAKRRLRKLSGKQSRFQKKTNHEIAKAIVETAKDTGRGIALEDLQGIRDRTTVRKSQRSRHHNWPFYQLRQFISYKAELAGVTVRLVDPRNTSKSCSKCGHCAKSNRPNRDDFACRACGYAAPADLNAAINIAAKAVL